MAVSLSFSDASKQLFISQSAVSQSVKVLEKKLGITLFIRSTKRVQLTPEGETLLRHIEPAMNLIKRGEAQIMEAIEIDYMDESEVLSPADDIYHINKKEFKVPFVCGARDLGEALRSIADGASMIRTKGEPGT